MHFESSVTKATDTTSEYVILVAFLRQQWLNKRASILRLYVHCLSVCLIRLQKLKLTKYINDYYYTNRFTCKYYKNNIKIAPTCFGVITPSSGISQFVPAKVMNY